MRLSLFFAAFAVSAFAQSEPPSLQSLVGNSPFGTAASSAQNAPAAATPVEFRGTFVDGGERFFSLVDTGTRRSEWVSLNETGRPFTVKNYDAERETITVEYQGRVLNLKLHSAKIGVLPPMQAAQAPAQNVAPGGGQPAPNTAQAQAPQPASVEAQRLAQVAEEIRRRRALRQQTAQQPQPVSQPPRQQ